MNRSRKTLPPLDYLLAFEVTGKLGSFSATARTLHISESAVSRKVKLLEEYYGSKLFKRGHRSITITSEGAALLESVSEALSILQIASMNLLAKNSANSVTLSATHSVASLWLMPKLQMFHQNNPDLTIAIVSSDDDNECLSETNDLVILRGDGNWPDFDATLLFGETVFPVCSPEFLKNNPKATDPTEIANTSLIDVSNSHSEWMNWATWLSKQGVDFLDHNGRTVVNTYPLAVQAAVDGVGVALGWRHLIDQYINDGRLVCPLEGQNVRTLDGYYLLVPKNSVGFKQRDCVKDWLLQISSERKKYFELALD